MRLEPRSLGLSQEARVCVSVIGLLMMSGAMAGLFLWRLVNWRRKSKSRTSAATVAAPPPPLALEFQYPPDPWNVAMALDPQMDYVKVLAKPRSFQDTGKNQRISLAETEHEAKNKGSWRKSWLFRPLSKRERNDSQHTQQQQQRVLKRSLSGPLQSRSEPYMMRKWNSSGPIYSDGTTTEPVNRSRNAKGSLSGSATPDRLQLQESPYQQLRSSHHRALAHAIYVV